MFELRSYLFNLALGRVKGPLAKLIKGCLFIFSLVYGAIVVVLARLQRLRAVRLNARVISVGNLTLGGTGKTTLVEYLAIKYNQAGKRVAILSRGYKRDSCQSGVLNFGDEPAMLAKKLPQINVIVNRDRIKAAKNAIGDYAADTLILDDGFQQWKIVKDLEIVTLDAKYPFGNSLLLPAGFLREPKSALKRAKIFVLTQVSQGVDTVSLTKELRQINSKALIVESRHEACGFSDLNKPDDILGLDTFCNKQALIFSGIGNPQGFEDLVVSLGIDVVEVLRFADHYKYLPQDLERIKQLASSKKIDLIITTEKDAIKILELGIRACRIFSLNIKLKITKNEDEFNRRLF